MSKKTQDEGVIDAKAGNIEETTAVVTAEAGQVSTQTNVAGVSLRFPFVRVGQALSQWRSGGRPPALGDFYIGKDKTSNIHVADAGSENGFNAILLDVVQGVMEDKPFTGAANPPRRWVGPNAADDARKEGFDPDVAVPTGQVWPDSGRPIMRANASRFCYLQLLVPVPEDFDAVEFQMFPIGDKLYTPARIEYSKGAFRGLVEIIGNVERMEKFRHRHDADYRFTWSGKVVHVYTTEATSKQTGAVYPMLKFGLAMNAGKAVELTDAERADFTAFLASVASSSASLDDVDTTPEF